LSVGKEEAISKRGEELYWADCSMNVVVWWLRPRVIVGRNLHKVQQAIWTSIGSKSILPSMSALGKPHPHVVFG
jgi:hypothetical protein